MNRHLASSSLAATFFAVLLASCSGSDTVHPECESNLQCGQDEACSTHRCEQQRCVEEDAPLGALANSTFAAPACHRFICDGNGQQTLEVDITAKPTESAEACHRFDCDPSGTTVIVVDPTVIPQDEPGDCMHASCDAKGDVMYAPDVTDEPQDEPGDCMKSACDASGNATEVPGDDPPIATCQAYTCQNGQAVGMPQNQGKSCSPYGVICGGSGQCDACSMPDASCTDPGPGAGSYSLAEAHNLGDIGWCDTNGYALCGALKTGVTAYFRYIDDGSGSFCSFDPYLRVQATAPVTLCEYFDCPSVECPSGTMAASLEGAPGCCTTGANPAMVINPSCYDAEVHITVESQAPSCAGYFLYFHT